MRILFKNKYYIIFMLDIQILMETENSNDILNDLYKKKD
jgi:hypothetical protein